jgi:hypothetical protein
VAKSRGVNRIARQMDRAGKARWMLVRLVWLIDFGVKQKLITVAC